MIKSSITYIASLILLLTLVGCGRLRALHEQNEADKVKYELGEISNIDFQEGYKRFTLDANFNINMPDINNAKIVEISQYRDTLPATYTARLVGASNIMVERVAEIPDVMLVIADMTLSEEQITRQRDAVKRLQEAYPDETLYVALMWGGSVSKSVLATDYILNNHFVQHKSDKYLLRSILSKIDEMSGQTARYFSSVPKQDVWLDYPLNRRRLLVFSDGAIYDDNRPIDPAHFDIQQQIARLPIPNENGDGITVDYINFPPIDSEETPEREGSLQLIVDRCKGSYHDQFILNNFMAEVLNVDAANSFGYKLELEYPDNRLFTGGRRTIIVGYNTGDTILYTNPLAYKLGALYTPVTVNGTSTTETMLRGFVSILLLILLFYVALQFALPYIQYRLFRRRYVAKYDGPQTIIEGTILASTCYYCKSQFEVGDSVVAKCKHTMHEDCWKEAGYQCPDYGARCKEGRHYYNSDNLFDNANAPTIMRWLIMALIAALLAWGANMLFAEGYNSLYYSLRSVMSRIIVATMPPNLITSKVVLTEYFALSLTLFTSLYIAILTERGNWLKRRVWRIVAKVILCCVTTYLCFFVTSLLYVAFEITYATILIDILSWMLMIIGMIFILSYGSDIQLRRALTIGVVITILATLSIYIWRYVEFAVIDVSLSELITSLIVTIGFSIIMSRQVRFSDRYFLQVSGAIKQMDIAIYKWFGSTRKLNEVTVGKSVNCNLNMSWDLSREIAPLQFTLTRRKGALYITANDKGVKIKGERKEMTIGVKRRLYHSEGFVVGRTQFTYLEMDQ